MIHPVLHELARMLPPPGTTMSAERQLVLLQAWDACLALIYGGSASMIWIGEDRQVHIAPRPCEEAGQVSGDLEYLSWIGYLLGDSFGLLGMTQPAAYLGRQA